MGYKEYELTLPVGTDEAELRRLLANKSGLTDFSYRILHKSLDARHKRRIVWRYRLGISSPGLPTGSSPLPVTIEHPSSSGRFHVVVVGTGPAGLFAALYLLRCGVRVTLLERGDQVERRRAAIAAFEQGGSFDAVNNYAYGEGGAGTFSDGKLSSRTKGISAERDYIFADFIKAGAPAEIAYLTHPHLGSDRLFDMTGRLRAQLLELGATIRYSTAATDLQPQGDRLQSVDTTQGRLEADAFLFANGHSAFDTSRMLLARGVPFRAKNFALGFRAEHRQEIINQAQWGCPRLPGVKAAEYRLACQAEGSGVYSFCMCPGGTVVPAMASADCAVVNGKSDYARDGRWANAAVVAGLNLETLLGRPVSAAAALDWLEALEQRYKAAAGDFRAPAMTIADFLSGSSGQPMPESSYPLGLWPTDLAELLPTGLVPALRAGLAEFCRTLRGYEDGIILGLESKTSAPIQAVRHPDSLHCGYENLYLAGEGSGWSGGIVSSAADGLKVAQSLLRRLGG
ncbi:MAG: hypothetical protein A2087_07475 [Spirochaetes bacterium GWD1_61_31]|nr:MAG: hypothetical protein A2Y37_07995 [Spirochaetes bacterium GWB1_60_80]OHD34251.1 MAG: hypothetical protein A2004_12755 [Spirochaetes bacterium GWC1_61_12]OHD40179.1 MAG: hypothetical protein A2087_07475 [Spirochaetes bacterium GWD1_61_31]OHD45773.1 MAG: hypothetical protein A2Y35_03630 [Spirochaetes bacterium GWE1_60_18]OHD58317.1 MAG: hypothetical protein A2Y32_06020 [Spirochaetes bacterium GWF1_60_12]HAX37769.1 FAD-dependent oxidoreductase [Spirochaetaceae bacterium]